ncbi:exonuclease [Acidaminococcus sp. CAG:917]|nr:exonuclease [Acidaminococcus sp. CAG:917]
MSYLFFDIECCDGKHMCSFGYVVCDEKMRVLKKEDILINPEYPFRLARKGFEPEIKLAYPPEVFAEQPNFSFFYDKIKELVLSSDMVLGHAVTNDVRFLNIACSQYKLQQWKYCALDTQKVFAQLTRSQNMSLEHIAEKTGVSIKHLHKSDDDAELTMEAFKAVLKKIKMTPEEIAEICPTCVSYTEGGTPKASNASAYKILKAKVKTLQAKKGPFSGKTVCFSEHLEKKDTLKVWAILKEFCKKGGQYTNMAEKADYFVRADFVCKRHKVVQNSKVMDIFGFAQTVGLDFKCFAPDNLEYLRSEPATASFKDMLKAKGGENLKEIENILNASDASEIKTDSPKP